MVTHSYSFLENNFSSFENRLIFCKNLLENYSNIKDPKIFLSILSHLRVFSDILNSFILEYSINSSSFKNDFLQRTLSFNNEISSLLNLYSDSPFTFRYNSSYVITNDSFEITKLTFESISLLLDNGVVLFEQFKKYLGKNC